jgi:hypothetical protein
MPTSESHEHATPNGGVRSTIFYRDDEGNPCEKEQVTGAEIIEYDKDGKEIFRTYLEKPAASRDNPGESSP